MQERNIYMPIRAEVEEVIEETANIKTFVIRPEEPFPFRTGQFAELTVPGVGEAPFTPSSSPEVSDRLEFTIMKVGRVTSALHEMKGGEVVGLRGPFGKGYPLEEFEGKEVLIVGGGVGLAPLRSLLYALFAHMDRYKKVLLRYGARSPKDLVYRYLYDEWQKKEKFDMVLTVDRSEDGWTGHVGVVTTILEDIPVDFSNSVAVVCGPPIMMKFVTFKLLEAGYAPKDIYLSMERNMSCGLGKCGHCILGPYYVCKDGPVFTYEQLKEVPGLWE
ncbi:MAG: oxidoreductase [Candidatus Latescibacterota bacterium]|nr:MAG: oxidoreductase [Candidatus Latescibacterota bacterium]